jgi:Uma2 family endonuclease
MTISVPSQGPWTIDDLADLPGGVRYQIADGELLVSPPPSLFHADHAQSLHQILANACPAHFRVLSVQHGINSRRRTTYYEPDISVVRAEAMRRREGVLAPEDVLLVVEVLSPSNKRVDLILKRHDYAESGIPQYWIVDDEARTLTVLRSPVGEAYQDELVIESGKAWTTEQPFTVTLDPGRFT